MKRKEHINFRACITRKRNIQPNRTELRPGLYTVLNQMPDARYFCMEHDWVQFKVAQSWLDNRFSLIHFRAPDWTVS